MNAEVEVVVGTDDGEPRFKRGTKYLADADGRYKVGGDVIVSIHDGRQYFGQLRRDEDLTVTVFVERLGNLSLDRSQVASVAGIRPVGP